MSRAADRLADELETVEQELAELKEQIERDKDREIWAWTKHEELPEQQSLPVPRLELVYVSLDKSDYNRAWLYRMVYRHFLGHCVGVPLGYTQQGGGREDEPLLSMVPFRDGAHINHDSRAFGWPMYIVRGDEAVSIPPRGEA